MQIICHGLNEEDFPVEFSGHKIFLGRDDSNSIVVKSEGVSRYHALLIEEDGELFIQDNDSLNGTYVNCEQIYERRKLSSGDFVQIGFRLIKVDFQPDERVILDFVSPDQIEVVSTSPGVENGGSEGNEPAPMSGGDVDRTMVIPGVGNGQTPVSGGDVDRTMVLDEDEQSSVSGGEIDRTMVITSETQSPSPSPIPPPIPLSSDDALFPGGSEIGKYVIIKRIGKGGMGEVYLAKHKTLGISRALKILPKEMMSDNGKFFDRFIREAKLASEIRHPNVVGVMDVETDSSFGYPYIVMEYIDGGSLRNSLTANGMLSEEQAVVIVEAVASALRAAEEHHIVHRDIKPDNIMFTKQGEVKLADLGIAKKGDTGLDLTKTNMMIGTPAYLPPEQAQNAKSVDERADIYSLGATFYEMLTGEQPYPGETTIEVLHKLFSAPVPDPRKVNPAVSAASAAIVMKMMAKNPKDRFQNANELLEMMDRTFPVHTQYESGELIKKVIAGECQNSAEFTSSISSSHLFLWWFKIPNKKLVLSALLLFIACCVVGMLFLFLGKRPQHLLSGTGNMKSKVYQMKIKTLPNADIQINAPDGQMFMYSSGAAGTLMIPDQPAGKYTVSIFRNDCIPISRDFELKGNMLLDMPLKIESSSSSGKPSKQPAKSEGEASGQSLVVTTEKDVVSSNDRVVSLREAFEYANKLGNDATITFAKDLVIRLSSPLTVSPPSASSQDGMTRTNISENVILDAGNSKVTIIGPEKAPMFDFRSGRLTLKNLSLVSDYSSGDRGGILDVSKATSGSVSLISVKDGGKAEWLWNVKGSIDLVMDGNCRLHRLHSSGGANVMIGAESVLGDAEISGVFASNRRRGDCKVSGLLRNATVTDYANVYVLAGGTCENLTAKNTTFIEHQAGTINELKVEFGAVYGYTQDAVLTGMVSLGGVARAKGAPPARPIVGKGTDIEFDLTGHKERYNFSFNSLYPRANLQGYFSNGEPGTDLAIIDRMKAFDGARNYTVRVNEDQKPGRYLLASSFGGVLSSSSMSLAVDSKQYAKALAPRKNFSTDDWVYSISDASDSFLSLTIRKAFPQKTDSYSNIVFLEGEFVEQDVFELQGDRIVYTGSANRTTTNVSVNGKPWRDLRRPFVLGFVPKISTVDVLTRGGMSLRHYSNRLEFVVTEGIGNDPSSSYGWIGIGFKKDISANRVTQADRPDDSGDYYSYDEPTAAQNEPGEEEKLQGVIYSLNPHAPSRGLRFLGGKNEDATETALQTLQRFVLGQWQKKWDGSGSAHYSELDQFFKNQRAPGMSYFYQTSVTWKRGAEIFQCSNIVGRSGWAAIYSGYVVAPFTGKFRFLGFCDDSMVVRFNRQIVID